MATPVARFLSVAVALSDSLFSLSLAPNSLTWKQAQLAAAASYFFWELSGSLSSWRLKTRTANLDQLINQGMFRTRLLTALRRLVKEKKHRIHRLLSDQPPSTLANVRKGLDPNNQIGLLLDQMIEFLREELDNSEQGVQQNFRVGLYVLESGQLKPIVCRDYLTRRSDPFRSYRDFPERFRLDNRMNPTFAVQCLQQENLLIVEDGTKTDSFHLHEAQKSYLKSLLAYPTNSLRYASRFESGRCFID